MLTAGIIGGMGPEATVDLMRRVIELTPARDDQDHIRMLVDNNPQVPSRIAALIEGTGADPAPVLIGMARGLAAQGADFLAMPCNTAHHYHDEVAAAVGIPFLSIPELVRDHVSSLEPRVQRLGLLASSALRRIRLYEPWLESVGIEVLYPEASRQADLMELIRAVKADGPSSAQIAAFQAAADNLIESGAEVLLIACTELSVIAGQLSAEIYTCDAADLLAKAVVAQAMPGPV